MLRSFPGRDFATFGRFIQNFLAGSGWPLETLAADGLREVTDVTEEEAQDVSFRSRMFHYAAFNRIQIQEGSRIKVRSLFFCVLAEYIIETLTFS